MEDKMDINWKEKLEKECNNYLIDINNFQKKWTEIIIPLVDDLQLIVSKKRKERDLIIKKAHDFYESRLKNLNNNSDKQIIESQLNSIQLNSIQLDKKDKDAEYCINYATDEEIKIITSYIMDYTQFAINSNEIKKYEKYPFLMLVLGMTGGFQVGIPFHFLVRENYKIKSMDNSFSMYCQEQFWPLFIKKQKIKLLVDEVSYDKTPLLIEDSDEGYKIKQKVDKKYEGILYSIKDKFVNTILEELKNTIFTSPIDLAIFLSKKNDIKVENDLMEFKRLYEESVEQIKVSDQRYYYEKRLEQEKEQAEFDREQRERQFDKQQQRDAEIEEQRRYEERERRNAEKRYQRDQLRLQEQQANDERRYREQEHKDAQQRNEQQLRAQRAQSRAVYQAQIAQLEKEMFTLHGPSDGNRLMAVKSAIRDLEWKRDHDN